MRYFRVCFEHVLKNDEWWKSTVYVALRTYINLDQPHCQCSVVVTDWIVSPQNPYVKAPTLNVIVLAERAVEEVIKVKWDPKGGT